MAQCQLTQLNKYALSTASLGKRPVPLTKSLAARRVLLICSDNSDDTFTPSVPTTWVVGDYAPTPTTTDPMHRPKIFTDVGSHDCELLKTVAAWPAWRNVTKAYQQCAWGALLERN